MKLKLIIPAALLFFLPWLVFCVCGIPDIASHVKGPVLVGVVAVMMASPLLTALFVHYAQWQAGRAARRTVILVGMAAVLVNSPVILLVLFISLYRAAP